MKWTFTLPLAVNFHSPAVISTAVAGAAAQQAIASADPHFRCVFLSAMTFPLARVPTSKVSKQGACQWDSAYRSARSGGSGAYQAATDVY